MMSPSEAQDLEQLRVMMGEMLEHMRYLTSVIAGVVGQQIEVEISDAERADEPDTESADAGRWTVVAE